MQIPYKHLSHAACHLLVVPVHIKYCALLITQEQSSAKPAAPINKAGTRMLARLRWSCSAARWLSSSRAFLVSFLILSSSWLRIYTSRRFIASTCGQRLLECPELHCRAVHGALASSCIISREAHGACMYTVLECIHALQIVTNNPA